MFIGGENDWNKCDYSGISGIKVIAKDVKYIIKPENKFGPLRDYCGNRWTY